MNGCNTRVLPTGVSRYVISLENDVSVGVIKKLILPQAAPALDASVVGSSIPSFGLYENGQTYKLQFQVSERCRTNDASAYGTYQLAAKPHRCRFASAG